MISIEKIQAADNVKLAQLIREVLDRKSVV